MPAHASIRFDDTSKAFYSLSNKELKKRLFIFRLLQRKWIAKIGTFFLKTALKLRLPVIFLMKKTLFPVFAGGESPDDCLPVITALRETRVHTILDYSVEANSGAENYTASMEQILAAIRFAGQHSVPFVAVKLTALGNRRLLRRLTASRYLKRRDRYAYARLWRRINHICTAARVSDVMLYIDAEETWVQGGIDHFCRDMMRRHNRTKPVVHHTVQMYRTDGRVLLEQVYRDAEKHDYYLGMKLVRGAYMEKERERALYRHYDSPIQPGKKWTDRAYNEALRFCMERIDRITLCAATHNEVSTRLLVACVKEKKLPHDDPRVWFSQLYGMSDHMTYTLANEGFNTAKYLPYGPVKEVMPYLIRRSEENTAVAGQSGRELELIRAELRRRKKAQLR